MKNLLKNIIIHPSSEYMSRGPFFEFLSFSSQDGVIKTETQYSLSLIDVGAGVANRSLLVVVPPRHSIQSGFKRLCLIPVSEAHIQSPIHSFSYDSDKFRKMLIEKMGCSSTAIFDGRKVVLSVEGIWAGLFDPERPRVFRYVSPCTKDELKKIKDIDKVVEFALHNDVTKDDRLIHIMKAQIPKVNMKLINPEEYMPYAPHGVIVTNTKTGKSTIAGHISPYVIHRPTIAHLIGWSNSDHIQTALLDSLADTVFIDEYTEKRNKEGVSDGLLSFMEFGDVKTARGLGNRAKGVCPIVFMGNPDEQRFASNGINELLDSLRSNLEIITTDYGALGSRIGIFVFTNSAKTGEGHCPDNLYAKRCQWVLQSLQAQYADYFSSLFRNEQILSWLSEPFEDWYISALSDVADQCQINEIHEFLKGQKHARRHVHGAALHIAFVESYQELLENDKLDVDKLLTKAQETYLDMLGESVSSFNLILKANIEPNVIKEIVDSSPLYIQHLLLNLNTHNFSGSCKLDWLEEGYISNEKYGNFEVFKIAVTSSSKCKLYLAKFGLTLMRDGKDWVIVVVNPVIWQNYKSRQKQDMKNSGSFVCGKCGQFKFGEELRESSDFGQVCEQCNAEIQFRRK